MAKLVSEWATVLRDMYIVDISSPTKCTLFKKNQYKVSLKTFKKPLHMFRLLESHHQGGHTTARFKKRNIQFSNFYIYLTYNEYHLHQRNALVYQKEH